MLNQVQRRLRPLARRRASSRRPLLVAMRARKPWVRARCRLLGLKVRFIARAARVLIEAKGVNRRIDRLELDFQPFCRNAPLLELSAEESALVGVAVESVSARVGERAPGAAIQHLAQATAVDGTRGRAV